MRGGDELDARLRALEAERLRPHVPPRKGACAAGPTAQARAIRMSDAEVQARAAAAAVWLERKAELMARRKRETAARRADRDTA